MQKLFLILVILVFATGMVYALNDSNPREAEKVIYKSGHAHSQDGTTQGAVQHNGGTDSYGCHNGSVPYHCH